MTLTLTDELDLNILRMYQHRKMNLLSQGFQKLQQEQDRQKDRRNQIHDHVTFMGNNKNYIAVILLSEN